MRASLLATLVVVLIGVVQLAGAQHEVAGKSLGKFKVKASDGKTYTNETLFAGKPVLLVYLTPIQSELTNQGLRDWSRLSKELSPYIRVVGILGTDAAKSYVKEHRVPFLVVHDVSETKYPLFRAVLDARWDTAEFWNTLILPSGKPVHLWRGYSRYSVAELLNDIEAHTGTRPRVNLGRYPKQTAAGTTVMYGSGGP